MIPCSRQEILGTQSVQKFSEVKELLAGNQIVCDYSIIYRDSRGHDTEMRHLYVRDCDYKRAREVLGSLSAAI